MFCVRRVAPATAATIVPARSLARTLCPCHSNALLGLDARWLETETAFFSFSNEVEGTTTRRKRERGWRNSSGGGGGNSNCPIYRYNSPKGPQSTVNWTRTWNSLQRKKRECEVEGDRTNKSLRSIKGVLCACVLGRKVTTEGGRKWRIIQDKLKPHGASSPCPGNNRQRLLPPLCAQLATNHSCHKSEWGRRLSCHVV